MPPKDRELHRWLAIVVICLIIGAVGSGRHVPLWLEVILRPAFVLVAALILVKCVTPWFRKKLEMPVASPFSKLAVPENNVFGLKYRAGSSLFSDSPAAKIFALAVVKPTELRQRLVETYVPNRRTVCQRVSIDCQIPKSYMLAAEDKTRTSGKRLVAPPIVYFPLLIPGKGEFLDEFAAFNADGSALPVLSYREYLQLAACTLRALLLVAFNCTKYSELPTTVREAEKSCLQSMMRRASGSMSPSPAGADVDEHELDLVRKDTRSRRAIANIAAFDLAANLVRKLTHNYGIVAVVQPAENGRFLVGYEQRALIPDLQLVKPGSGLIRKSIAWLRVALGARPVDVTVGIENACTSQSYHLFFKTEGLYLTEQQELDFVKTTAVKVKGAPTLAHMRFRKRLGQSHGHFYSRYFPESQPGERPRIRFRFGEVPPGSLLRAAITAAAGFALVWLIGMVNSDKSDPGTDAPAFLLAFPAIVAAWLGFEGPTVRLLEGTLLARFSLIMTAAQSLSATGLFMAHKAFTDELTWWKLPGGISILGVNDVTWATLLLIAIANAGFTCYKYVVQTYMYSYYAVRQGGSGVHQNG